MSARKLERPSRRLFLRGLLGGAAVAVGLPIFEMMLNGNGDAFADGEDIPTRFGLWFFGNGVHLPTWTPPTVGPDWTVPEDFGLVPLLPYKDYVSVISGLSVKTPRHPHHSGMSAVCSGGPHLKIDDVRDTIVSTMKYPSIDQVAAQYFQSLAPNPYKSLEVAVTRFRGTDEGTSFQHLSHNGSKSGETNVNPSEESPHAFFDRLFNKGAGSPLVDRARGSVLDAVSGQIKTLQGRLGAKDKQRLEQHLTSISEIESRLNVPIGECNKPDDPGAFPDLASNEQIAEKNKAVSDLVALALSCGLTRSFSIQYSTCGSGAVFWMVGATDGQHYMNHTEPAPYTKQKDAVRFTMGQLAYFLDRLKNTPDATGNLLDHSSIFVCTEHTEGWTHAQDDLPMLLCGKGGGRLRGNVHYRQDGGNASRALMTALRGAGLPLAEFGYEEGYTKERIAELETA
ncbi:DUF1552 domain-containing protein [Polyangium fumosum]|uniref:DUF1552 domain-containing protein n=1 Tax=Polyangium fumosum TaxID=889272 RepID=A0A4U1IMC6_9BACT|nr:DUF1552 domain-containing protein [Polyangium fumosum]TKC95162.1 DUF1552 domain-containing protein [Polyangium fumosum]